jgi:hypothetical protein
VRNLELEIGLVAGAFRDIIARLRKAIVESGDNTPFENRIRFFFRKYCTTVAFHLLFKIGLLNLRKLQSSSARNQESSSRGALESGLTSADSGLQLDREIALNVVSAKLQPHELFSSAEDGLKHVG